MGSAPVHEEDPAVWEDEVRALEAAGPVRPGLVVFAGSSSIRMWTTLERDLAPLAVVGHGFGGAQMDAVLHYAPRLVLAWRPRGVVLYAGENDLEAWRGKTPERVMDEVRRFAALVGETGAPLWLLSLKPSPARAADRAAVEAFNESLQRFAEASGHGFVDIAAAMTGPDGSPRRELFLDDGLHLSPLGYATWTAELRPRLLDALGGICPPASRRSW